MNIQRVNTPSFGARVVREQYLDWDLSSKKGEPIYRETFMSDVLQTYDDEISKLKRQREKAKELDEFMHSQEVALVLGELPQGDVLNLNLSYDRDNEQNLSLEYKSDKMSNDEYKKYGRINPLDKNGKIDAVGIANWLTMLYHHFRCGK